MQSKVTNIAFHGNKNCFLSLPRTWTSKLHREKILVYEISSEEGLAYASWAGSVSGPGQLRNLDSEVVEINGLYGSKLALKHGQQVLVSPVFNVTACHRLFVEPLSPNDWEILEMHSTFVEGNLLNQVRVVWAGQVFPIWVQKSICVFVKIARVEATSTSGKCFLIEQNTEVIVSPKVRAGGHYKVTTPIKPKSPATPGKPEPNSDTAVDDTAGLTENVSLENSSVLGETNDPFKDISGFNSANTSLTEDLSNRGSDSLGSRSSGSKRSDASDRPLLNEPYASDDMNNGEVETGVFRDLPSQDILKEDRQENSSTAVKPTKNDHWLLSTLKTWWQGDEPTSGEEKRAKGVKPGSKIAVEFDGSLRVCSTGDIEDYDLDPYQTSVMTPVDSDAPTPINSSGSVNLLHQSTNVFISLNTLVKHSRVKYDKMTDVPTTFYAILRKLDSPTESNEKMKQKMNKRSERLKRKPIAGDSKEVLEEVEKESGSADVSIVVRVVIIDLNNEAQVKDEEGQVIAHVTSGSLPRLPAGHVMLSDQLRRQLGAEVTGRVRLTSFTNEPHQITRLHLHPLFQRPSGYTADMLETAFEMWLSRATSDSCPFILTPGTLAKCWVKEELCGEFLLTFDYHPGKGNTPLTGVPPPPYVVVHPGMIEDISVEIQPQPTESTRPAGIDQLPYWTTEQFDLALPKVTLKQLGGVEDLANSALDHISMCLGLGPLTGHLVRSMPGLHIGGLLMCGPRGAGKTSLAQGVCNLLGSRAPWPYVVSVDCKALKGKRPENVKSHLEIICNELAWRQPGVLLLEDLDQIVAAPSGPEQEMSGEAQYFMKVAEVLKDLMLQEKREGSHIAVVATCKSPGGLHPSLVAPTGHHLFQETVHIKPPDQKKRQAILEAILMNKNTISFESKDNLDLGQVAQRTEGYVARDLETVVDKAIHAHLMSRGQSVRGQGSHPELLLTDADLESALKEFTPAALRNVTLHQAGELGWGDIGGLHDVRRTLVQTLEWPARYPKLFASCPLRLRSGILLYGAPGTGKTLLAGVVAKECGLNFISIKGPELLSKYIGASEQAVRDTFIRAQSARPCILFFDEFDSLAPRRGHDSTGVTDRVVNQLLTQLDGVEGLEGVYVLGATSRPDLIDPALLRPGRLDKALHCAMPLMEERLEILKALTRNMELSQDADLKFIAENSEYFTGADFKALLYNAQLEAIHEVTDRSSIDSDSGQVTLLADSDQDIHSVAAPELLYMPNLEEGITTITAERQTKLLEQVKNCLEYPISANMSTGKSLTSKVVVQQSHLVEGLRNMAPSVSQTERDKYHRIYEHFVSSRGGNFSDGVQSVGKRATLA